MKNLVADAGMRGEASIHNFQAFAVEGLDIDPSQVEKLMSEGFERMLSEIALF